MTADAGFDRATIDRLLTTTRAVRRRLDLERPVPLSVIEECLSLAIQAPTGSYLQGWRWVVVTDPRIKQRLADLYRAGPPAPAGAGRADHTARLAEEDRARLNSSTAHLASVLQDVPVLVVPCAEDAGGAAGWAPSIYPAVWSFMLALRSRGLGSVLTTVHLYRRDEADELLGVPDGFVQACLLPVAYTIGTDFRPAKRRPVAEVAYLNGWGRPLN